jgi:VWFA-related protein
MRVIPALLTVPLLIATLTAQQPAPAPGAAQTEEPVFRSDTRLVVQQVTVKDKDGKPIENLAAKDFTITENGIAQTIAFLDFQKLEEVQPAPVLIDRVAPIPRLAHSAIAAEKPLDLKYSDRRLLALYFDMSAMPPADQLRALTAAEDFIRKQMTAADLCAIMAFSGNEVLVHEDFTADRERLLSTLETMIVGEDEDVPASVTDGTFGQNGGEFAIFRTDRQLSALQTAAKMLGNLNEKKSLIYFASGLQLNGTDNQAQLRATINAATRAGVSFFTVDARGLVASAPMGDATRGTPGGNGAYTGASSLAMTTRMQRSQDTLWSLSADTGGKALLDVNDLGLGIVNAQKAITSYYVLGFYTSNATLDGKQRKIKITLNGELAGATLEYRESYFAGKEFKKFTTADKERQLEDAFMLGDPITELTMAMEVNYFQLNKAEYFVPIAIKIPGTELALAKRGGAEHTLIDFLGEIRSGGPANNIRDKIDIKLSDATAAELANGPITYDTGFTVLPGNYKIKFLARDAETGRIGTYETSIVIPNLNPDKVPPSSLSISSVVLSSQRKDMDDAAFNATKDKDKNQLQQAVNPLVQEGQKLIPSVTRVFSKKKPMWVYLQAYQQGTETPQPLAAFVTFYRGSSKAFETTPVIISERVAGRLNTMPIKLNFELESLVPGEYSVQLTVLNPASQKAAFWQAPVMVVP